jgi:hypothetical protein
MARGVSDLPGVQNIRTMQSAGRRSIPRNKDQTYLDLYMLNKEQERLMREDKRLFTRKDNAKMRKITVEKRMVEMEAEIGKLHEAKAIARASGSVSSSGGTSVDTFTQKDGVKKGKKGWKKMTLNY